MDNKNPLKFRRLKGYDYSRAGAYYITICTNNREYFLGDIINAKMKLNAAGRMVESQWLKLEQRFDYLKLDSYILMPNHIHAIIIKFDRGDSQKPNKADKGGTKPGTISRIIQAFKSLSTRQYIKGVREKNWLPFHKKLWQPNYYDRIIRNDKELNRIRQYIEENPLKWEMDKYNRG